METLPRLNTGFSILPRFCTPVFGKFGVKTGSQGIPRINLDPGPLLHLDPDGVKIPIFFPTPTTAELKHWLKIKPRPTQGKNPGNIFLTRPRRDQSRNYFRPRSRRGNYNTNIFDPDAGRVGWGFYPGGKKSGFIPFNLDLGKTLLIIHQP